MKKTKHYHYFLSIIFMLLVFTFSGCGKEPQPSSEGSAVSSIPGIAETEEQKALRGIMRIQELNWPDPDLGMKGIVKEGQKMQTGVYQDEFQLIDGAVYREAAVYDKSDHTCQGNYIQKLEAPYESWTITAVPLYYSDGEKEYFIRDHYFYQGKMAFCVLLEGTGESRSRYWASCDEAGEVIEVLGEIPKELESCRFAVSDAGNVYAYEEGGRELVCLSSSMEPSWKLEMSVRVHGIISGDSGEKEYWYGDSYDKGFGIYDLSGEKVIPDTEGRVIYDACADRRTDGKFYVAGQSKLWLADEKEMRSVCDFGLCDYPWQEVHQIEVQEDGSIMMLGKLDNQYCLVNLVEDPEAYKTDKQEIVIAFGGRHDAMQKSISRFNRQNDKYHITAILREDGEEWVEYDRKIRMEISAGRGPDLISDELIMDMSGYLRNGYFASLEGVLGEEDRYLQAALEGGRLNGELYGMPYDFRMDYATYSRDFAGDRASWTLPGLMEAVEKSGAEILHYDYDGVDIVLWYGLYDNDNTAYIDWERGESHLTEEPFLKLLAFAKRYGDKNKGKHQRGTEGDMLADKRALATDSEMYDPDELLALYACFAGKPAILGYPRTEGNGIYVIPRYLYVNQQSSNKEGAIAFLQFLMSEEEQSRYVLNHTMSKDGTVGYSPYLPVHLDAFQKLIAYRCNISGEEKKHYISDERGVSYDTESLTAEQVAQLNTMLEQAVSGNRYAREIQGMISEELMPYFAGQKTAEEVAGILNSRVQLYLDERK